MIKITVVPCENAINNFSNVLNMPDLTEHTVTKVWSILDQTLPNVLDEPDLLMRLVVLQDLQRWHADDLNLD